MKKLLWSVGLAVSAIGYAPAIGVLIPGDRMIGPIPPIPGEGLCGWYWDAGPFYTNADALEYSNSTPADATFLSRFVDYPPGPDDWISSSLPLTTLLGADAATLDPLSVGSNAIETSIFRFKGAIAIRPEYDLNPQAPGITIWFELGSDDGSGMYVTNIEVIDNGGDHGFQFSGALATFELPGLYPVDLVYYENFGVTGIEWYSSIPGGPNSGANPPSVGIVPASVLYCYPVPEPGTLVALGLGAAALAARRRRR